MVRVSSYLDTAPRKVARRLSSVALVIVVITGPSAPRSQAVKFLGIGDLSGGTFNSRATDVSANGSVVVGRGNSALGFEAFRWTSGGIVGLGDLPDGSFISDANGVSADGSVITGSGEPQSGAEAFRWTSVSGMVGLGDFAGGFPHSTGINVSADGSVVVGQGSSGLGDEAFRWTSAGGMVSLGDLVGGLLLSRANAVSADGSVVVGNSNSASGTEAFRWTSGSGMVGLGDLAGGSFASVANDASADGSVIVGAGSSTSGVEAYRWTSGSGMVGLGDLAGGSFASAATGVSVGGSVIVGVANSASGAEAFVWDATNGMRSLKTVLLPSVGAALNGWTLSVASAVSADGRTIVGLGTNPSGSEEGWLAYLPDQIFWFLETSGAWDSSLSWSGPFLPGPADPVVIAPASGVTVTGSSVGQTVKSLTIGTTTTGEASLVLGTGDLTVLESITINPRGRIDVDADCLLTASTLTNHGVLTGTGQVDAQLLNDPDGEVRVTDGQQLRILGPSVHTNRGMIAVVDAEIEFGPVLSNQASTGLIAGQSATLRFDVRLSNFGSLALTFGVNNLFGAINNNASGKIVIAGGAHATFYDDVTQNGTLQVIKVGATNSVAVFAGAFTGSGGSSGGGDIFFLGDLQPGNSAAALSLDNNVGFGAGATLEIEVGGTTSGSQYDTLDIGGSAALGGTLDVALINGFAPAAGNSFEILHADGGIFDSFDQVVLPPLSTGLMWNVIYSNFSVLLQVAPGLTGDYNDDGSVDAADYVVWRKNQGTMNMLPNDEIGGTIGPAHYNQWRAHFGQTAGAGIASTATGSANNRSNNVPEPASLLSLAAGTVVLRSRRRTAREKAHHENGQLKVEAIKRTLARRSFLAELTPIEFGAHHSA